MDEKQYNDLFANLQLDIDDYSQTLYPKLVELRKVLVETFRETRAVDRRLAYLLVPEFQKIEQQIERLEKLMRDQFLDENKPAV